MDLPMLSPGVERLQGPSGHSSLLFQSGCTVVTLFVVILPAILEKCSVCCPCRHVVMHNLINFGIVFAFLLCGDPLELAHFQLKSTGQDQDVYLLVRLLMLEE